MMQPGLVIRDAKPADAPAMTEIYNQTVAARDATMDLNPRPIKEFRERIRILPERESLLVMEEGKRIVGWGAVMAYSEREGYAPAAETAVYLRRDSRRQGWGTRLKSVVIERARKLGYHHLVAKVYADNQASIAYNLLLGYEIVGTQREVGWVGGRWVDVTIMQLVLDDVPPPG